MNFNILLFFISFIFLHNFTYSSDPHSEKNTELKDINQPIHSNPHFSYEGEKGPMNWGSDVQDQLCKLGKKQSPVNIMSPFNEDKTDFHFKYKGDTVEILDNGHALEVQYQTGSEFRVGEKKYQLLQMHFHSPSEHLLDNQSAPLELHFVHKSIDQKLAVIGVLILEGPHNNFYENLLNLSQELKEKNVKNIKSSFLMNPLQLLTKNKSAFIYEGSLTTPPCSEGVQWVFMKDPLYFSKKQIEQVKRFYSKNARPVQLLNKRKIKYNSQ